jgi:RNA polymerase sigma-70 factor (ECF subfamily)
VGLTRAKPPPAADEAALAERARHDPQAFETLYLHYLDPVYRYCYRRLGNREQAEDATSQVFIKAFAAIATHRSGAFRSWLFTIAHNVVIDAYRRQRPTQPLDAASDPPDDALTPEEAVLTSDEGRALRAMFHKLTDDQRSVMELRLTGLTGVEIAQTLGRSHGSVKTIQFRAMTRLRVLLSATPGSKEVRHESI